MASRSRVAQRPQAAPVALAQPERRRPDEDERGDGQRPLAGRCRRLQAGTQDGGRDDRDR
jgi:hypothetical protein